MKYNPIYFYSEPAGCYVAMFPELPGCMADGETIQEALSNLKVSAGEWLYVNSELGRDDPKALSDYYDDRTNPSVNDVAVYILKSTGQITTYALQKLLYYCQAWSYGWMKEPLFLGDFEAWKGGPVSPTVFRETKGRYLVSEDDIEQSKHIFSDIERRIIELVLAVYNDFDGTELSDISHMDTPWIKKREGLSVDQVGHNTISPEDMMEYYGNRV